MKRFPLFSALTVALAALESSVGAQTPTTPPPVVGVQSPQAQVAAPVAQPNQIVYSPRLPTPQELSNIAAAQGLAIDRVEQTADQVTVIYRLNNGQTNTVAYMLLPTPNRAPATVVTPASPAPAVVYSEPPAVIYSPRAVYYDPFYYDPWYYYPPVSVGIGLRFGYHGGYYHHGYAPYRGGGHWHR